MRGLVGISAWWVGACVLGLYGLRLGAQELAVATAAVLDGKVSSVTVLARGAGYLDEPPVRFVGGGGSGATARAVLRGDQVWSVEVVDAGMGYLEAPRVVIGEPAGRVEGVAMAVQWVPKLSFAGLVGGQVRVEWSAAVSGPWEVWTNVMAGTNGLVLVDLEASSGARFYRAVQVLPAAAPEGFVRIEAGTFPMGSPAGEEGRFFDETLRPVTLTRGYWISDHEVTQAEYESVMGVNPSYFKGAALPVERVSWEDAVEYCRRLTGRDRGSGRITVRQVYRLPTEAEWENAARAGSTGARHGELDAIAWWSGNSGNQTRPVRQKAANAWGLHDMLGNVWEWCGDWYGTYPAGAGTNPTGPSTGTTRVLRGGCWGCGSGYARSAFRNGSAPGFKGSNLGFRPVLAEVD